MAAKKAPPKKAAPKKTAKPQPEPKRPPEFVKKASAADRKAALEAVLEKEAIPTPKPPAPAPAVAPPPLPPQVREASPADRKAAVEQLVEESGVASALSKAPWKRSAPAPAPAPAGPPQPAAPAPKTAPRAVMTKAPLTPEVGRSAPRVVILDSNALMMQFQFHVDIEKEVRRILNINFDVVVPRVVVHELERIAKEGGQKEAGEARMALELAKTFRVEDSGLEGDTAVLRLAEKLNAIVVTNDKRLRAMLRAKAIPNIYMRSRAFLTIEGHIPGM
ncbi:MAG: uncharacterized protein QOE90_86 [Thermoplasmata archaeon]|jgi:rRNA-processing protein FCF1|nr:uncharacterized protein [Thermoplasmata archaeon]